MRGTQTEDIPWFAITDSEGQQLITSDRPTDQGPTNIGCPFGKEEQAWFVTMIKKTRQRMSSGQLQSIEMSLAIFAKSIKH